MKRRTQETESLLVVKTVGRIKCTDDAGALNVAMMFLLLGLPLLLVAGKLLPWSPASSLQDWFSLNTLPPKMHVHIQHLLMMPVGAVIVVFFRLTLGIRVLGPLRPILIAFAFEIAGFLMGSVFLFTTMAVIAIIRPMLRSAQMPYFARIAMTLSLVAILVVITLQIALQIGVQNLLTAGFLPVVVLTFAAEGFAKTLQNEGLQSACWRALMTVLCAILINIVSAIPGLRGTLLQYPELLLTSIGLIFILARYFGFRALQNFNPPQKAHKSRKRNETATLKKKTPLKSIPAIEPVLNNKSQNHTTLNRFDNSYSSEKEIKMKIAVVRDRKKESIINNYGRKSAETYGRKSVQRVMDALRAGGHEVKVMEGDIHLFDNIKTFMPPDENGQPTGMVFNMSYGIQGDCRYTHVPAMLEMAGVPYTGSSPMGQTLALDKVITKSLLLMADVPTPKMAVMARPDDPYHGLSFPLVVKPRHESTSNGLYLVHDHEELITAVLAVTAQYRQEALVEEYIPGRELCIGVLGNAKLEILPMVELDFNGRKSRMQERDDKFHRTEDEPEKICPAPLDPVLEAKIRHIAAATFRACHCRDYARVDLRIDPEGNPYVLEINSMASLGAGGTYVQAAKNAGYTFESLVNHIVALASKRYGLVTPEKKIQMPVVAQAAIVSLPLQRNGFTPMQDSNALGMAA